MENDKRGRGRPDNEAKDQRDARLQPPIDLAAYRRWREEQGPDWFLNPEGKEVMGILREWMDSVEIPQIDVERAIARMRALPKSVLGLGKDRHPNSIVELPDRDIPLNQNRKTIVDFQAHKERGQRQEPQPPQNKE